MIAECSYTSYSGALQKTVGMQAEKKSEKYADVLHYGVSFKNSTQSEDHEELPKEPPKEPTLQIFEKYRPPKIWIWMTAGWLSARHQNYELL